jgi:hypothetical protein
LKQETPLNEKRIDLLLETRNFKKAVAHGGRILLPISLDEGEIWSVRVGWFS